MGVFCRTREQPIQQNSNEFGEPLFSSHGLRHRRARIGRGFGTARDDLTEVMQQDRSHHCRLVEAVPLRTQLHDLKAQQLFPANKRSQHQKLARVGSRDSGAC